MGFIVHQKGINLKPAKTKAIQALASHNLQIVKKLHGEGVLCTQIHPDLRRAPWTAQQTPQEEHTIQIGWGAAVSIPKSQECSQLATDYEITS